MIKPILSVLTVLSLVACGGGGGGTTVSNSEVRSPAVTVRQPSCALKTYSSSYPSSYLGSNSIPTPAAKFDPQIMRGIGLKDYHPYDINNNCASHNDYARLLYKNTLDRLQSLNVDTVEIYEYAAVDDFNATTWTSDESRWQIPKSELLWFFNEAHTRGLKVTLVWQLWPVDNKGNTLNTTNTSETETLKIINGWKDIITNMAKIGKIGNVDNLQVQWSAFYLPSVSRYSESSTLAFLSIVDSIRNEYNGKLFMGTVGGLFFDKRLIQKVDAIVVPISPSNWFYIEDSNISVPLLKQRYKDAIDGIYLDFSLKTGMDVETIPIIWDFNIQSRDKALSNGWVEDGFCITYLNSPPTTFDDPGCMQKNYVTDFSIQSLAIEGAFQAINEQSYFKTYGINFSTGYWHTDTLVPGLEGFPNLSQSIRGKPAESIVKYWFSKS